MTTSQRWVPQSPQQIRSKRFGAPRFGRRGYATEEVDQYLARLAEDAAQSASVIADLRAEIERVKDWIRDHNIQDPASHRSSVEREAMALLTRAQQEADRLVAAAREQARQLVFDAQGQRDEIVAAARGEAERAARAYRDRAGATYNPDTEAQHRQLAWLRTVAAALGSIQAQLPAVAEQVEAVSGLLTHEVRTLQEELGTDLAGPAAVGPGAAT